MTPADPSSAVHEPVRGSYALDWGSYAPARGSPMSSRSLPVAGFAFFKLFFLCCLDYCFILRETLVFEFMLVNFFSVVLDLDFYSTFTTSASFG
jgi:hypothetical protein